MNKIIKKIVWRNNYLLDEEDIDKMVSDYLIEINNERYNFLSYNQQVFTQRGKKRAIYSYNKESVEDILCKYLKIKLDNKFRLRYSSRNKIMNTLFGTLPVIKDLNDFVIIKTDFKSFFDSVFSQYVYNKYIKESSLSRSDKDIFQKYISTFEFCYAGLSLSNVLTEIICRDFDKNLRAKLEIYGVVYCERYVDDILIILNSYITESDIKSLINLSISEIFDKNPVRLNEHKFTYISRRNISAVENFDFLGYNFTIKNAGTPPKISFEFGLTEVKINKYYNKIKQAFLHYLRTNETELLRQQIKIFSTRILVTRAVGKNTFEWVTKVVVTNYCELRYHINELDDRTAKFMRNCYFNIIKECGITSIPYFLRDSLVKESSYNICSSLRRNRSIIFDEKIGIRKNDLIKLIHKINPVYSSGTKTYYQIVMDYFELIQIE